MTFCDTLAGIEVSFGQVEPRTEPRTESRTEPRTEPQMEPRTNCWTDRGGSRNSYLDVLIYYSQCVLEHSVKEER